MVFGTPQRAKPLPAKRTTTSTNLRRPSSPPDNSLAGNLQQVLDISNFNPNLPPNQDDNQAQSDAPLIRLVNSLLLESTKRNASDVHIEPLEDKLRIRFRIDGVLQEIQCVPLQLAPAITSRLKIMANLDICEKRIPQDGSIKLRQGELEADFRMSTLPSAFGEKVVLRVMGTAGTGGDLEKLGIPEFQLKLIRDSIKRPDGLVLVTGPTGSGKTTTLYAALKELNDPETSLFTAEDPVEGTIPGVTQCQVNAAVGYTFASILRSLLRQDPDVVLVGEIRDQETAEISIKAALTGHLVLSTLHTNSAVATISRLLNMGIAPYLITSAVSCIVAQRLVRRICPDCKKEEPAPQELLQNLGPKADLLKGVPLWRGTGCATCHNSGFKGRAPLYEVLSVSDELRQLILAGASQDELKRVARMQGMKTLRDAGLDLVREGVTTLSEILGVTNEDADVVKAVAPIAAPASSVVPLAAQQVSDNPAIRSEPNSGGNDEKVRSVVERWKALKTARVCA